MDFPGSPEIKTSPSCAGSVRLIPGWGTKIPYAWQPKQHHKTETVLEQIQKRHQKNFKKIKIQKYKKNF